jgi:hypothetical protein
MCTLQVTLVSRFNGVGYTFVLAGFLKIVTVGGLTLSAPTDVARTAFGKATPYLMIPVGLGMCWVAKQVWVQSTASGVTVESQGEPEHLSAWSQHSAVALEQRDDSCCVTTVSCSAARKLFDTAGTVIATDATAHRSPCSRIELHA